MKLHLNDLYYSVQGEGANCGRRALFVRMPFCNLACSWCDTQFNHFKEVDMHDFVTFAQEEQCKFAVLTGGEPSMHKHTPNVIGALHGLDYEIAMETNGCFNIPAGVDWVCVSPKRDAEFKMCQDAMEKASEYKYVVDKDFDLSLLERHGGSMAKNFSTRLWLSPEFTDFKANVNRILEYIVDHPEWRLSLQTHKWIGVA